MIYREIRAHEGLVILCRFLALVPRLYPATPTSISLVYSKLVYYIGGMPGLSGRHCMVSIGKIEINAVVQ